MVIDSRHKHQIKCSHKNMKNKLKLVNKTLQKLAMKTNQGGVTYDVLLDKDYLGTPYISIAPFPERSQIFEGKATRKMILNYCNKNSDLLLEHFTLGAWFNKENKRTYLDVAALIPIEKQDQAVTLGRKANQVAGFNLSNCEEIPIGGIGEFNSLMIPLKERFQEAMNLMSI